MGTAGMLGTRQGLLESVLPIRTVEVLRNGRLVQPIPAVSTLNSRDSAWEGIALESFSAMPGCSIEEHEHPVDFLSLQTDGCIRSEWTSGGRTRSVLSAPGTVYLLPRGSRHRITFGGTSSRVIVTLDPRLLREAVVAGGCGEIELVERWDLQDPHIAGLMLALYADLRDGQPAGPLYGETLAAALAVYLTSRYRAASAPAERLRGGLPGPRLRRVLDYVEQRLTEPIRLRELADVAGMRPSHFSELFRQSTGLSPYRYVLRGRIEKAQRLLRESKLSVLDVALATGFADQSHFAKTFRRFTGTLPTAYRAGC